ncbi:MAG TPA: redoxin domain-containing protein [Lacibacter sp.]|nr:redoxin domain-containing protein [Lacibacter sp.]HMO88514.1 redoxin domain-containing protein [Lacibacter sp.]
MKHALFFLLALTSAFAGGAQGYRITVSYQPVAGGQLYLGYYYGDKKYLQDSARIGADGTAVFSGNERLTGGLYIVVDPEKQRFFDVLIDKDQDISIRIDPQNFRMASISGSPENLHLDAYQQATQRIFKDYGSWQEQLRTARNRSDSTRLEQQMNGALAAAQQWRDSFVVVQPDSYLSLLFRLLKEPVYQVTGKTRQDTLNAYYAYKKAYWQDVAFGDERLLRTPMFEQRLTRYMEQVVTRHPDSLKQEADRMILSSRGNTTMFRYYLNRFTNEYMNPKYMGLDVVFLHLFEKYYLTNQVDWLEEKDRELVYNRAYSLMGNIVGEPAADLQLLDTAGRRQSLYGLNARFTLLVFWDPDCSHCREQVPRLDSFYRAAWKQWGVQPVGVLVDTIRSDKSKWPAVKDKWTRYIRDEKLAGWQHWYQSFELREDERRRNLPNYRQSYDVYQTPTLYLLDKDKRILAKKIGPDQLDEFLRFHTSQQANHP